MRNKFVGFVVFLSVAFGLDQLTKVWARSHLKLPGADLGSKVITVIAGFFDFAYVGNPDALFSLGRNWPRFVYILYPLMFLCLLMIGYWFYRLPKNAFWNGIKLGLVAGGAIGNILDRLVYGKVTDFIVWKITTATKVHQWPTFNLADMFLVVGLILIFINWPKDPDVVQKKQP